MVIFMDAVKYNNCLTRTRCMNASQCYIVATVSWFINVSNELFYIRKPQCCYYAIFGLRSLISEK